MIIPLLITAAAVPVSGPLPSIFGIIIGEPLALSECIPATDPAKYHADTSPNRGKFYYKFPESKPCYEKLTRQGIGESAVNEVVHVQFPLKDKLATAASNAVAAQLIDGKVEFVTFNTKGRVFQEDNLAVFTAKFGKPITVRPVPLQNGYGTTFEALIAIWSVNRSVRATYSSFAGEISSRYGDFSIGTARGKVAIEAQIKRASEPSVAL